LPHSGFGLRWATPRMAVAFFSCPS
jgi:hypothetical protein